MLTDYQSLLPHLLAIAKKAGQAILAVYQGTDDLNIIQKPDATPVTAADMAAHHVIAESLTNLTPHLPILSEEGTAIAYDERKEWSQYWLVDPLDGTKEFIKRNGEFTVNIALISDNCPVIGVIYAPVGDVIYFATEAGPAYKQQGDEAPVIIQCRSWGGHMLKIAGSRSHGQKKLQTFLQKLDNWQLIAMGSSLKSCLVAEGSADIYPRLGPTSEWDTAAAQCIVEQAGGAVMELDGKPLRYNCKDSLINPWFMVVGDTSVDWLHYFKQIRSST